VYFLSADIRQSREEDSDALVLATKIEEALIKKVEDVLTKKLEEVLTKVMKVIAEPLVTEMETLRCAIQENIEASNSLADSIINKVL